MKLHWSPKSPYVRKVMVCAHELGIVDQVQCVRSVAAMLKPNASIMHDNPLSKIPTLVLDDGRTLFDSLVICEYLNAYAHGPLFPSKGVEKWDALRWHALADGLLDMLILWRNERERQDGTRLDALISAFATKTEATLNLLEEEAPMLRMAPLSIGTITVGCALAYADFRFASLQWRSSRPLLTHWHEALTARASFVATQITDD
jgi:glutathione S-transferase